tara:strand:- start:21 stop:623 length:603 start_codon:yes stop_codon:yes gene_type:complete
MKKLKKFSFLLIVMLFFSCSSDDDSSSNNIDETKPSKISQGNLYWEFEYDEDRVTSIKKFNTNLVLPTDVNEFNYNSSNELESITRIQGNTTTTYDYIFENGLLQRVVKKSNLVVIPELHKDTTDYFYNNLNQVVKIKKSVWSTPEPAYVPVTNSKWTEFYTYDANGNLETYSNGDENEQNIELQYTYYYNNKGSISLSV